MKDFSSLKTKFLNFFRDKKPYNYYVVGLFLVIFLGIGIFLGTFLRDNIFASFQVSGANFDLGIKKIPYNVKSIDISFNFDIDEKSVSKDTFKLSPEVPGIIKLKNSNTISYELSQSLVIGNDYTLSLFKNITAKNGKALDNDIVYIVKAVPALSVLKVLPEKKLENLGDKISVFYSLPVVNFSSNELREKLPCPIQITPEVYGKCKWITTSVVQFEPNSGFDGSTRYEVKIVNKDGLNYNLEKENISYFSTPKLTLDISKTFLPKNYISLRFNYPVSLEEVQSKISIEGFSGSQIEDVNGNELLYKIKPLSGDFKYEKDYKVLLKEKIFPKYGNVSYSNTGITQVKSESLVSNITPFENIFSETGALIDTKQINFGDYKEAYDFLPNKNIFFKISFNEEVSLNKNLFLFQDQKGNKVDFDIKYSKIEDENKEIKDDKKTIDLTLKGVLENDKKYSLIVSKDANKSLEKDLVFEYKTSKELKVLRSKNVDYSKTCVYLNNKLPCSWGNCEGNVKTSFSLSNSGIVKNISDEEYLEIPWQEQEKYNKFSFTEKNKYLEEKGYCSLAGSGEYLYAIDTRLKPNSTYKLSIKGLQDKYSNTLKNDFLLDIKTGELRDKDKYVYLSYSNFTNVYPKSVPVVLNFQTINTDKVYVDTCEMDEEYYLYYLKNRYNSDFKPSCKAKTSKTLSVKNNYWNLSNNKFDLNKDILGKDNNLDYVLISAYPTSAKNSNYAENFVIKTNLSLFLEKGANKSLLFATSLNSFPISGSKGGPVGIPGLNGVQSGSSFGFTKGNKENLKINDFVSDLELNFYDYNASKVAIKYSFNKTKKVYEIDSDISAISYITAKNKDFSGIITDNDSFSNYDYKYISGMDSSIKNYLYVYTDRPIYRPKDEVFIKGILREFSPTGFKKSKITSGHLKIIASDYSLYRDIEVKLDKNSNFSTSFVIPEGTTLGDFSFQFEPTGSQDYVFANSNFSIEEYRKPTFKVDINTDKEDFTLGEKTSITLNPKYYFGGKLVNTDGVYTVLSQNYFFDAKEYSDYQFGKNDKYFDCLYWGYCDYSDHLEDEGKFKISADGEYKYDYTFSGAPEKLYTFSFDVTDPDTKKTVSNSVTKVLHSTDNYVGVKANYYNSLKNGIDFDLIFLDYKAKEVAGKKAKVEIIKRDWNNVKKLGVDGVFYNEYALEEKLENTIQVIGDGNGKASKNIKTKSSGEYEIKVTYTGADGNSFVSSSIVYVDGDDYVNWRNDNNSVTELTAEKGTYKLGETANFTLKSPVNNGKALIVVEKDDGIIDYFVHDIKSYGDKISLKITDNHYPNVYLKAYLIGNQSGNPLPVYKRALSSIKVLTDYKNLNISIKTDKKTYKPGDKVDFQVEVMDKNGKVVPNANGSLSVVDESVLALKGNPKKNPYSFFYDMKRYLGVISFSSLKYLVEKLEVKDTSSGEKGGSGENGVKGGDSKKARGNFKDTAIFVSDFTTDENGRAKITLDKLPDNLTTWVIEALVNTPDDNKIGVNYETITTTKELMIEDNLPRFLSASDKITLSPVIYNRTGKDGNFKVNISASKGILETKTKNVFIKNGSSSKVLFDLVLPDSDKISDNEIVKFNISASNVDNTKTDEIIKYIPLNKLQTKEQVATFGKTKDVSYDENISLNGINNGNLTINYAGTLFSSLLDGVDYNNRFPYGCSEQKTSAIMPNIYIKKLYDVSGIPFDLTKKMVKKYIDNETGYKEISLDNIIKDYLIEIKKYQNIDGGFTYWIDGNYIKSDTNLTTYILTSLSEIKSLGYKFDSKISENAISYLKKEFYDKKVCDDKTYTNCLSIENKINILNSLLSANKDDYEVYKMYKLLDFSKYSSELEKAIILAKLSNISDLTDTEKKDLKTNAIEVVNKLLSNNLVFNPRGAFLMGAGDNVVSSAKFLEIIGILGKENFKDIEGISDNIVRFIISSKQNSSFGSTFDNSIVIKSLTNYLSKTNELKNTNFFAKININAKQVDNKKIGGGNIFQVFSKTLPVSSLSSNNTLNFTKEGTGSLYYDATLTYFVPAKKAKQVDNGFYVETKYYDYNEYKKIYSLKEEEYKKYLVGELRYEDLVYKKEVVEYLKPILYGDVGELVLVYNKIVTNEPRNQVAIESYIPSGSEIVNTNLATESKNVKNIGSNVGLNREELRDDRYFGWREYLDTGIYNVSYTIRLTNSGNFGVSPTRVSEFYNEEVFGRSEGFEFVVR